MNLFVDCHIFDEGYQGTRTYIEGLYREVISQAPYINLYLAATDIENLKKIFGEQPNVYYLKYKYKNRYLRLGWDIPKLLRKYKIDYAHFQYIVPLFKCCKEIVTIHDLLFLDFPKYFPLSYRVKNETLFRYSAKRADVLLTVSEYSRQAICRHYGIGCSDIYITPNAVSVNRFQISASETDEVLVKYGLQDYLLYVGRFEPRKNHVLLLKAFVELELWKRKFKLVFIGRHDIVCKEYEQYYQSLPQAIKENVLQLIVGDREIEILYKHCKLFVFPSLAEGFGIPPLEAVAYEVNTLCSNQTAMEEFAFPRDKFFNPNDLEELKTKISYSLDHDNPERLTEDAKIVRKKYNWKTIAHNYIQILNSKSKQRCSLTSIFISNKDKMGVTKNWQ